MDRSVFHRPTPSPKIYKAKTKDFADPISNMVAVVVFKKGVEKCLNIFNSFYEIGNAKIENIFNTKLNAFRKINNLNRHTSS